MNWFLYDNGLRHERIKSKVQRLANCIVRKVKKKNERRKNQENIITTFITSLKAKFDSSVFHQ